MFLANLNVFIPCLLLLLFFGQGILFFIPMGLGYVLMPIVLIGIWIIRGLVPAEPDPSRASRWRGGHWLLAVTNVIALLGIAIPMILSAAVDTNWGHALWILVPILAIGALTWPVGLFMVWSSGG
jgi:hypothetical protein